MSYAGMETASKKLLRCGASVVLILLAGRRARALFPGDDLPASSLSSEQVVTAMLARNAEQEQSLRSYESSRRYRIEYKGFPSSKTADMEVSVRFTAPDKKEIQIVSAHGSSVLINRVLKRLLETEKEAAKAPAKMRSALTPSNYRFDLLGTETLEGRLHYVVAVQPLRNDTLLYRGKIWIDANDFAVVRIEAEPARNPSFWISKTRIVHRYSKVGSFWLPADNQSESDTRLGGHARLSISYTDYKFETTDGEPRPAQRPPAANRPAAGDKAQAWTR